MEPLYEMEQMEWINGLINWAVFIILPAFVGSYASDYFKTLKQEDMKISFRRVVLASTIAIAISAIFLNWIIYTNRREILLFVNLVLGLLGFELLYGLSSIDNMITLLKKISALINPITTLIRQINEVRAMTTKKEQSKSIEDTSGFKHDEDTKGKSDKI